MSHGPHQHIMRGLPKLPLGAVEAKHPLRGKVQPSYDYLSHHSVIHLEVPEEPLQAFVMRVLLRLSDKGRGKLSKIHTFDAKQGN